MADFPIVPPQPLIPGVQYKVPNPADQFLSGFVAMANINRKRQELEEKLQLAEQRMTIQQSEFNQRLTQNEMFHQANQFLAEKRAVTAEDRVQAYAGHMQFIEDRYGKQAADLGDLHKDLSGVEDPPGTLGYTQKTYEIFGKHSDAMMTPGGRAVEKNTYDRHNKAVQGNTKSINADWNAFKSELKVAGIVNERGEPTIDPFEHPQAWEQARNYSPTGKQVDGAGNRFDYTDEKTMKTYQSKDAKGQVVQHWITLKPTDIEQYTKRYHEFKNRINNVGSQIDDPSTGVRRLPADPLPNLPGARSEPSAPIPTRVIERGGHHYEVDDNTKTVIRQVD